CRHTHTHTHKQIHTFQTYTTMQMLTLTHQLNTHTYRRLPFRSMPVILSFFLSLSPSLHFSHLPLAAIKAYVSDYYPPLSLYLPLSLSLSLSYSTSLSLSPSLSLS